MIQVVVIGTSWGGLNALTTVVQALPPTFPAPVVIVQHRSRGSGGLLAELLQEHTRLGVREVEDKESLVPRHVYLAPPDYHLLLEHGYFSLSTDEPVRFSRPSIDVTFVSAADTYGRDAVGVILTGANNDGAFGLRRLIDRGGHGIVQDPATAESPIMPAAAARSAPDARVLPLGQIAPYLSSLTSDAPAADGGAGKQAAGRAR